MRMSQMAAAAVGITMLATNVSAQVLGTFSWQMQPYCNTVTLTLTTGPTGLTLDGSDDQCGASTKGGAVGMAVFNPNGSVGLNFLIVASPGGQAVHVSAQVNPSNGQGTWTDSAGHGGAFAFFGAASGSPRPVQRTVLGSYAVTYTAAAVSSRGSESLSFGMALSSAPAAHLLATGAAPTADCPGTASSPAAAPGHLCVYTAGASNVDLAGTCITNAGTGYACGSADPYGATLFVRSSGAGTVVFRGSWAVTAP